MIFACVIFLALISAVHPQTKVGESCVQKDSSVMGVCTPASQCDSAINDYQQNGTNPTFCSFSYENTIVCCRDGKNILENAASSEDKKSGNNDDQKRLSDRKCEKYSSAVTQSTDFIPLGLNPDSYSITAAKCNYSGVELIVGGQLAQLGEFPHMAAIGWLDFDDGYVFHCGGSLISSRFVLSAAHCSYDPHAREPEPVVIRLGDQNIDPKVDDGAYPVDIPIKTIHKHPDYKSPSVYHDIALFELNAEVEFSSSIRPACLWSQPGFGGHTRAIATGWGVNDTAKNTVAKDLQKVSLTLLKNSQCEPLVGDLPNRHWSGFHDAQLCAGELLQEKDTCQGDSGGPLQVVTKENQCIYYVMGVVSFGKRCAVGNPAVYARVSSYLSWIEELVWPGEQ